MAAASRVLVTAALPYANGSIHLGHMLEAVQTDVYVRARRMAGDDVAFVWADDTHGTPIELRARLQGITPEALIASAYDEHVRDYVGFDIGFDHYYTTHSPENRKHAAAILEAITEKGDTEWRDVEQLYCATDTRFLPDRFVRGTCPNPGCGAEDQYGDSCEVCGKTYGPTELIEPKCSICGNTPELRSSAHLFVRLANHAEFLDTWTAREDAMPSATRGYVRGWIEDGLADWDISRDEPYFGFEIPGHPGKYFYVWFDAPIGYISSTDKWCADTGRDFDAYWKSTPDQTEIVHVIGKDIVYFHCLFWPAMLASAGYTTPTRVQVHGWLQVNGKKMSKTRGTFILASTYLDHLPAYYLRYYLAAKLTAAPDDFDLSLEDFGARVNADLVNRAANLASRCVKFLVGKLDGTIAALEPEAERLLEDAREKLATVPGLYRNFESGKALRVAMEISEAFNGYVTDRAPWKLAKSDPDTARAILSAGIQASKLIAAILTPVVPHWGERFGQTVGLTEPLTFANAADPIAVGATIGEYVTLAERLDAKQLAAIVEASKETAGAAEADGGTGGATADYEVEALGEEIVIDDFFKPDLRVATVTGAFAVEGAKKLLRVELDVGPLGTRTVFSGISKSYAPAELVGKRVVLVANLKPRKMRFGVSEGMILASGASDDAVTVVELDARARPGERVT
jgi:methionyl-tRNA synthetase